MIQVVQLIFRTEAVLKSFRNGHKRFRDEEEAEDLEMTKMNIRRHLKELSTGFWSIVRSVCLVNVIEVTIQIFELEKEVIRFFRVFCSNYSSKHKRSCFFVFFFLKKFDGKF